MQVSPGSIVLAASVSPAVAGSVVILVAVTACVGLGVLVYQAVNKGPTQKSG